jgi:hypothetical protein
MAECPAALLLHAQIFQTKQNTNSFFRSKE